MFFFLITNLVFFLLNLLPVVVVVAAAAGSRCQLHLSTPDPPVESSRSQSHWFCLQITQPISILLGL
jgi:hypothetical protein